MIPSKLQRLKALLRDDKIAAYIVGSADAHQSEYVNDRDKRREYITNFTGSAGTAIITSAEHANCYLWTDGRYYQQAEKQLQLPWLLMKDRQKETPTIEDFLAINLEKGATVGIDPRYTSVAGARRLEKRLESAGILLDANSKKDNYIDLVWNMEKEESKQQSTQLSSKVAVIHPIEFAGVSHFEKIENLRSVLRSENCSAVVVSSLDEIAWLLNIRGDDIPFCPLVTAFVFVTLDSVILCIDETKLSLEILKHLGTDIKIVPYESVLVEAKSLPSGKVMLDTITCNFSLFKAIQEMANGSTRDILEKSSPIQLIKSKKNKTELAAIRASHIRDGCAMVEFLSWLDAAVKLKVDQRFVVSEQSGEYKPLEESLSEFYVGTVLESFRRKVQYFHSLSFETIAGFGPNASIIHYRAEPSSSLILDQTAPFLLDSGGQFLDGGTTDVTRTLHFGTPTTRQKEAYTAVLKGHLALSSAKFPSGTSGIALDAIARSRLWFHGLDYNHGTGHGVGSFLNVHEGPQYLANTARSAYDGGLQEDMTITNEPGYYETGNFGIRIENVLIVRRVSGLNIDKVFLEFENATCVPIATNLVDESMMSNDEISQLNTYNEFVRRTLSPFLSGAPLQYLLRETEPLLNNKVSKK
jgi:Xaa-Pro aminopeptidase